MLGRNSNRLGGLRVINAARMAEGKPSVLSESSQTCPTSGCPCQRVCIIRMGKNMLAASEPEVGLETLFMPIGSDNPAGVETLLMPLD